VRTLLAAGRYEEAAEAARELFESCTEAGLQVGLCLVLCLHGRQSKNVPVVTSHLQQRLNSSKPVELDNARDLGPFHTRKTEAL